MLSLQRNDREQDFDRVEQDFCVLIDSFAVLDKCLRKYVKDLRAIEHQQSDNAGGLLENFNRSKAHARTLTQAAKNTRIPKQLSDRTSRNPSQLRLTKQKMRSSQEHKSAEGGSISSITCRQFHLLCLENFNHPLQPNTSKTLEVAQRKSGFLRTFCNAITYKILTGSIEQELSRAKKEQESFAARTQQASALLAQTRSDLSRCVSLQRMCHERLAKYQLFRCEHFSFTSSIDSEPEIEQVDEVDLETLLVDETQDEETSPPPSPPWAPKQDPVEIVDSINVESIFKEINLDWVESRGNLVVPELLGDNHEKRSSHMSTSREQTPSTRTGEEHDRVMENSNTSSHCLQGQALKSGRDVPEISLSRGSQRAHSEGQGKEDQGKEDEGPGTGIPAYVKAATFTAPALTSTGTSAAPPVPAPKQLSAPNVLTEVGRASTNGSDKLVAVTNSSASRASQSLRLSMSDLTLKREAVGTRAADVPGHGLRNGIAITVADKTQARRAKERPGPTGAQITPGMLMLQRRMSTVGDARNRLLRSLKVSSSSGPAPPSQPSLDSELGLKEQQATKFIRELDAMCEQIVRDRDWYRDCRKSARPEPPSPTSILTSTLLQTSSRPSSPLSTASEHTASSFTPKAQHAQNTRKSGGTPGGTPASRGASPADTASHGVPNHRSSSPPSLLHLPVNKDSVKALLAFRTVKF